MTVAVRRALAVLLLLVASLGALPTGPAAAAGRVAADPIAHDPTMIRQGRYYYTFITGDSGTHTYLPMRRSTDLLHWSDLGPVFATAPAWVTEQLGTTPPDFWAPDISYFGGLYHLYYAASSFGTNNSVIGLATNTTLDPSSSAYRWVDHGMVVRSSTADNFNAIDPELVLQNGQAWLAFGSFWDGIKMRRLDRATGLLSTEDTALYSLASRGGASIEGASITRHGDYWYLFASLDYCCRGVDSDYRVVVGRSRNVTGPYVDGAGVPMLSGGGTEVLRGYNEFRGPGGGDVYGDLYVHHYYDLDDNGRPKLSVRPIRWAGGWPALGDPLSGSRAVGHGPAYAELVNRADGSVVANPSCGYEGADITLRPRRRLRERRQPLQQQGRRGRGLRQRGGRPGRPVGLARQRLPAVPARGLGRRLVDDPEQAERPGAAGCRLRRSRVTGADGDRDRRGLPAVPGPAGRRRAARRQHRDAGSRRVRAYGHLSCPRSGRVPALAFRSRRRRQLPRGQPGDRPRPDRADRRRPVLRRRNDHGTLNKRGQARRNRSASKRYASPRYLLWPMSTGVPSEVYATSSPTSTGAPAVTPSSRASSASAISAINVYALRWTSMPHRCRSSS
jgi:hypothetical protein